MTSLTERPLPEGAEVQEPEFLLLHKKESNSNGNLWEPIALDAYYPLEDAQKVVKEGVKSGILPKGQYAVLAEGVRMGLTDKGEIIYKQEAPIEESEGDGSW